MNIQTQKIKAKGYTLSEGLKAMGISLSTYRRYEKKGNLNYLRLKRLVGELGNKLVDDDNDE